MCSILDVFLYQPISGPNSVLSTRGYEILYVLYE